MTKMRRRIRANLLSGPYGLTLVLFVLAVFPGALGTLLVLCLPFTDLTSGAAAAVTEPVTTKLLPAYLAITITKRYRKSTYRHLISRPAVFGGWGGLWFGIAEKAMYLMSGATVTALWSISIGLHALFGVLVAGAVYWRGKEPWTTGDIIVIVLGIFSAVAVHTLWNVALVSQPSVVHDLSTLFSTSSGGFP